MIMIMKTEMRKHFRKAGILAAFMLMLTALIPAVPVGADEIYEPYDSDFYMAHSDECYYEDEIWETNAAGLRIMEDPESDTVIYEFGEIGSRMWIYYIYRNPNGGDWGYTEYYLDGSFYNGWIPMSLLWKGYNNAMFRADYADSISRKLNQVSVTSDGEKQKVYFYSYPGSRFASFEEYMTESLQEEPIQTDEVFTDEEGRKWGYVSYYYQSEGWICLESPDLDYDALWPDGAPERDKRERTFYEIVYNEDSTEVREIPDPEKETEATGTAEETDDSDTAEKPTETETETNPAKTEESIVTPEPVRSFRLARFAVPAAVAAVAAVSAAIVLIVVLRRKKQQKGE